MVLNMNQEYFDAGYKDGYEAGSPMGGLQMSQRKHDYALGYIVGHAARIANTDGGIYKAAYFSGKLTTRYAVSVDAAEQEIVDDLLKIEGDEVYKHFHSGIESELESDLDG